MAVKKYRLIPEKEYERLKSSMEPVINDNNILESKLPDDVKIKLFQEQKRVECNTRDRAELIAKIGYPMPVKKDVEIQHDQPMMGERGTSPIPMNEDEEDVSIKRKIPIRKKLKPSMDFNKPNLQNIASYLKSVGIRGNGDGNVFIDDKLVPESDYKTMIRQLSDARIKRSAGTNVIINELRKHNVPNELFSVRIMREIGKPNVSQSGDGSSLPSKWVSF